MEVLQRKKKTIVFLTKVCKGKEKLKYESNEKEKRDGDERI